VVQATGRTAVAALGDIGDEAHGQRLVARAVQEFGRLDVLVNNAAFQMSHEGIADLPSEEWDDTFRTNIQAMFYLSKAALPHLPSGGSIINTALIQAYQPSPSLLAYASTQGAIVTFTKALALEVMPQGVRINAVAPGPV
jgi:NAD(P)-dependent dehydrogenase (short-subunit alcohol dehydrogenase family)